MNGIAITDGSAVNALDQVIGQVPKVIELAGSAFDAIVAHPVLLFFFSVGLVGTGLGVFKMLKRTAKG